MVILKEMNYIVLRSRGRTALSVCIAALLVCCMSFYLGSIQTAESAEKNLAKVIPVTAQDGRIALTEAGGGIGEALGVVDHLAQTISFSVCCKWFRWSVLPQAGTLEAEIYRDRDLKQCMVCGWAFVPKSNRAKYCPLSVR